MQSSREVQEGVYSVDDDIVQRVEKSTERKGLATVQEKTKIMDQKGLTVWPYAPCHRSPRQRDSDKLVT